MEAWREATPEDFCFAMKASRYISHMKNIKDPEEPLENVLGRGRLPEDKLGPVLFQLPPNWHLNAERPGAFLDVLPDEGRHVFEFRDPTWFDEAVYELPDAHDAAFCIHDTGGEMTPLQVTADWVYVRFHGPTDSPTGHYQDETLSYWADRIRGWQEDNLNVYCYFSNDRKGYAVRDALGLREKLAV